MTAWRPRGQRKGITGMPVIPPPDGDFTAAHVVVTVTWPGGSKTGWIECPLCCAAPVAVTRFEDMAYYDFGGFGRVAIPLTPAGFDEQWLACFPSDTDERWLEMLHAFREQGYAVVRDEIACPLED